MKNGMRGLCRLNESRAVWMLKGVRRTGNCVCVLSDAPERPKWVRLTVKCKSRWMKREEKLSSFPCWCTGVTFCLQKGAEMPEKSPRLSTSFPHSAWGPSRAAGLVSWPQHPAALWHDGEFTGHRSLASGPPTALAGIHFARCGQSVGWFSPAATSGLFLLPLLLVLSFSYFQLSWYFFITKKKKNTCLPMGCKKGLANIHLLLLFAAHKNLFCHAGIT